ncbi:TIR domain-containing protein [Nafulsella turpanensis]|uniref:TIR domain-containing protein n=1 Tax=Nafulsella turpanensis TaxID=1265690 RepID=UPI0003458663|nr:TIR domain-containing protein [Nafulsella turpanensis]
MLKLFISYSHKDEQLVSKFHNHLAPLKSNGTIEAWYDRKLNAGASFQEEIDNNLENADIICLMISDNFLASNACILEKDEALKLRMTKGTRVVPIILSSCAWIELAELSDLLATPTDGKPVTKFEDQNDGWLDVVTWLKKLCQRVRRIRDLKLTEDFNGFLKSADILSKSHSNKEILELNDIFVFPKLDKTNDEGDSEKYDSELLKHDILEFGKILIAGENQSGRTTLCKVLFGLYRSLDYVPVYLDDENKYLGNPITKLEKAFEKQYSGASYNEIESDRLVPIVDNFHFAKSQEKYVEQYKAFKNQVLIVDDIFSLSIKNETHLREYSQFLIREFSPVERDEVIRKWIQVKEATNILINPNHLFQSLDEKTELIENSLGVLFGKGIMPSYPFFILSLLAAQETNKPLDQDITSQGHCYQALIYLYLRKEGVRTSEYDIYLNFLTELAYRMHTKDSDQLTNDEFQEFILYYNSNFNLPIPLDKLLSTLSSVNICKYDSLNHYSFCYIYIYYFFVAKYYAENINTNQQSISRMLGNLHKDENAYITIFMAHHSKSNYLLDELILNAEILFSSYGPASLNSTELSFFDKHEEKIIKAVLPTYKDSPDEVRKVILKERAEEEDIRKTAPVEAQSPEGSAESNEIATEIRRSIKTVEVMGIVIKNRAGSLDLKTLEYIFEQGLKVHLRILSSFFEIIREEEFEDEFVKFITERLNHIIKDLEKEQGKEISLDKIEKIARNIFWNLNFGVVYGFITKAIHSLGSSNLMRVSESVSKKENTPSSFIVHHGISMWYGKSLKINEISERLNNDGFSTTASRLMRYKVVEHTRLHKINPKDLRRIEEELGFQKNRLFIENSKNKK